MIYYAHSEIVRYCNKKLSDKEYFRGYILKQKIVANSLPSKVAAILS
jgi:hypothetical protein